MKRLRAMPWLLLATAALLACSAPAPAPEGRALCPEPKHYTAKEEKRAAAELLALPPDSVIAAMIADYGRERAELRGCRGERRASQTERRGSRPAMFRQFGKVRIAEAQRHVL